jgi:hypothetical protein
VLTIHGSRIGVNKNQRSLVLPIHGTIREGKGVFLDTDCQYKTEHRKMLNVHA